MKDKQMIVLVDDEFLGKVDYIQRINDYKSKSETIRKTVEKEYIKEVCDGTPHLINITGIEGKGYVRIIQTYIFPDYYRYDLDIYDEHGDCISIYIPRKEKEDGHTD